MKWWESLGIKRENLRYRDHDKDELAFYSKATVDIEYKYPFTAPDFGELEGIAHRGEFDLTQHQKHSGIKLDYFDLNMEFGSEDPADPSKTTRVLTIMLAEEY